MYGGSRCFSSNTLVISEFGIIPICNVKIGDKILSGDTLEFKQVVQVYNNETDLLKLNVNN